VQRRELVPDHITLNAIAPGIIDTPQLQVDADDAEITGRRGAIPGVLHVTSGAEHALVVEVPDEDPTVLATCAFRGRRIGAEVMGQPCDGRMNDREGSRQLGERGHLLCGCGARCFGDERTPTPSRPRQAIGAAPATAPRRPAVCAHARQ
jgi:hypothetical protein